MPRPQRKWWARMAVATAAMLTAAAAFASEPARVPLSVEIRAGLRAVAAMEPDAKIRNPDTLAREFLSPAFWHYGPLHPDFQRSQRFIKFYRMGSYYSVNACTHHVDAILREMAADGLQHGGLPGPIGPD